jgi:class 3 adenylate cyclase/tetratricopeptide (TPR) repeat protein
LTSGTSGLIIGGTEVHPIPARIDSAAGLETFDDAVAPRWLMTCPTCGTANPVDARFCFACGTALHLPRAIEGERKIASVLFADVVGSTTLAERLDPEDWAEVMNGAFAFMNAAVDAFGGNVARLMGDAILAFFGDPVAHEDDAERAIRAGLEICDMAKEYGRTVRVGHGVDFAVRVGIDTGLIVLTTVGDARRSERTAMGDTPNVAARLQSLARPNTVLISGDTYVHVRRIVDVEPHGELTLQGKGEPVAAYEVLGIKARPARARGIEGLTSPLVGREREVAALQELIDGVREGRGGLAVIVGDAGIGKSRLVAELRGQGAGVRWLEGRALSYAQGVHYFPWRQVILESIGSTDEDAPETVRKRLEAQAVGSLGRPTEDLPLLEAVLAVEGPSSRRALSELDGPDLIHRVVEATRGYLLALANHAPTVVVFEDLHWADSATADLVEAMGEVLRAAPLLVVCVLRQEVRSPFWTRLERLRACGHDIREFRLSPLGGAKASELLANLLHVEGLPERVRSTILDRTDGNPFFIEEVIRSLIDSGHIVRLDGGWRAVDDITDVSIPDTLAGVLSARIDRLPEDTRQVAQTAAVIGRAFAHTVLAAVMAEAPEGRRIGDLATHVGLLSHEELVRERRRHPELEYIFKHALTQEAAYERLLLRHRKELHRRTGYVLERLHGEHRDDVAPILAHHFDLGEAWIDAARYHTKAAARSFALSALQEALDGYEAAIAALERSAEAPPAMMIDATIGWTAAVTRLRLHEQPERRPAIHARIDRGIELARALDDKGRLAQVLVAKGNVYALSGFPGTGFEPLLEAYELAREVGDESLFIMPYWAATEMMIGRDPRGAAEQFTEVVELARRHRNKGIEAHASASKAVAHARLGEGALARRAIAQALEAAPLANSIIKEADVNILAANTFYDLGELDRGLEHSRKGTELAFSVRGFECACGGYQATGFGKAQTRRFAEALSDFEQAILLGTGTRMEPYLHVVRGAHAAVRLREGEHDALAELEAALDDAERTGDDHGVTVLHQALGEMHLHLGQPQRGQRHLETALAAFRERGMRPYVARVLAVLADAHDAQGRSDEAAEARSEAERIVASVRADDDLDGPEGVGARADHRRWSTHGS